MDNFSQKTQIREEPEKGSYFCATTNAIFIAMRRQNMIYTLLHWSGYCRMKRWLFSWNNEPAVRFVTFHDILPGTENNFKRKLHILKKKANVISLNDYFRGKLDNKSLNVVITFDDGYKSWVDCAVPALRALDLPATFFISSGFVGLSLDAEADFIRENLRVSGLSTGGMSANEVRDIAKAGFTIGGHTRNHINLGDAVDEVSVMKDIAEDKRRLEELTGGVIDYFAYPFGVFQNSSIDLVKLLKKVRFVGAVTTKSGFNTGKTDPFMLKRELTGLPVSMSVFWARVSGAVDDVAFLKKRLKKMMF